MVGISALPQILKPTECVTWYNLILLGFIGGIGIMVLSELIKDKTQVRVKDIVIWGGLVPAIATVGTVWYLARSSK